MIVTCAGGIGAGLARPRRPLREPSAKRGISLRDRQGEGVARAASSRRVPSISWKTGVLRPIRGGDQRAAVLGTAERLRGSAAGDPRARSVERGGALPRHSPCSTNHRSSTIWLDRPPPRNHRLQPRGIRGPAGPGRPNKQDRQRDPERAESKSCSNWIRRRLRRMVSLRWRIGAHSTRRNLRRFSR